MADYSSLKILLIEDNQHMRSIVTAILKGSGIRNVREARDGAEGLDMLRQYPADIALVDFNMDPIDGVEFTKMLRNASDSSNPYLPIIMITGHSERSRVIQARDSGVNEFVVKPLTARALLGRMDSVIMRPRPFIRCRTYFGPDRRRTNDASYSGPLRRNTDGAL
ncbi:response regulator [Asticcacaulis sp. 201]|uniref:response regulator n=1 Tax=Asticcacaulis sp. 201 TaxID=3028787 RepID=UPI002916A6E4|nr:response regulator [Asticcacaulis sp. 201]MDV6332998.1 response regulator [Asticcacaulis sp. 201]